MQKHHCYQDSITKDREIYWYYSMRNTSCFDELQRKQSGTHSLQIKFERSICVTNFLNGLGVLAFLVPRGRGRHSVGPRYLMACFPYVTVLKHVVWQILSSWGYIGWFVDLKRSDVYVGQMSYLTIRIAMFWSLWLFKVTSFALLTRSS